MKHAKRNPDAEVIQLEDYIYPNLDIETRNSLAAGIDAMPDELEEEKSSGTDSEMKAFMENACEFAVLQFKAKIERDVTKRTGYSIGSDEFQKYFEGRNDAIWSGKPYSPDCEYYMQGFNDYIGGNL